MVWHGTVAHGRVTQNVTTRHNTDMCLDLEVGLYKCMERFRLALVLLVCECVRTNVNKGPFFRPFSKYKGEVKRSSAASNDTKTTHHLEWSKTQIDKRDGRGDLNMFWCDMKRKWGICVYEIQ